MAGGGEQTRDLPAPSDRESRAEEFDERDGLVAGQAGMPRRVADAPKDLRVMAKKTWLFLTITTLLNIHNTIDGGTATRPYPPCLLTL